MDAGGSPGAPALPDDMTCLPLVVLGMDSK